MRNAECGIAARRPAPSLQHGATAPFQSGLVARSLSSVPTSVYDAAEAACYGIFFAFAYLNDIAPPRRSRAECGDNAESGIGARSPLSPHHRNGGRRPQSRPAFPETLWVLYHTPARRAPCLEAKTGLFTICSQTTKAGRVSPFQRRNGGRRPAARTSRLSFSPAGSVVASSFGRGVHWTPATRSALLLCRGVHRTPAPSAPSLRHIVTFSPADAAEAACYGID